MKTVLIVQNITLPRLGRFKIGDNVYLDDTTAISLVADGYAKYAEESFETTTKKRPKTAEFPKRKGIR